MYARRRISPAFRKGERRREGGIEGGGKVAFSAEFIFLPFPLPRFALITTGFSYLGNGGFSAGSLSLLAEWKARISSSSSSIPSIFTGH